MTTVYGVSAITDPLNHDTHYPSEGYSSEYSEIDEERPQEPSTTQSGKRTEVLHWSVHDVKTWLQQNVPFGEDRMQECLRSFENKGIDGLSLLTLQRTHPACIAMNDFDWLLLKAARKRLLSGRPKAPLLGPDHIKYTTKTYWAPPSTPSKADSEATPPDSPLSFRPSSSCSSGFLPSQDGLSFTTPKKLFVFPRLSWNSDSTKDEQIEILVGEVQSLRGEIVMAEERETTLQAQMYHLDELLRTAMLSGYLYTRTRWIPVAGEPPIEEDGCVDDWIQRFIVLKGTCIFFYLRSTDLRPQGTIPLEDIVEVGQLPADVNGQGGASAQWFSFHITTCHGLRLECSTQLKLQMDSWLTCLQSEVKIDTSMS